jgi:hypothetical protein
MPACWSRVHPCRASLFVWCCGASEKFNFTASILDNAKAGAVHLARLLGLSTTVLSERLQKLKSAQEESEEEDARTPVSMARSTPLKTTLPTDLKLEDQDIELVVKVRGLCVTLCVCVCVCVCVAE